jgi:hypothetical protein
VQYVNPEKTGRYGPEDSENLPHLTFPDPTHG